MARRGRKPNPKVEQDDLKALGIVRQILPLRNFLVERNAVAGESVEHGNTRLRQGGGGKKTKRNGKTAAPTDHRGVRLNLQVDVATFLPADLSISGDGQGSEA